MSVRARQALAIATLAAASLTPGRAAADASPLECAQSYEKAQIHRQRGKLIDARDAALVCARPECPEVARKDCKGWLGDLERAIPTVVVLVRGEDDRDVPGAQATVDGVRREVAAGRAFELDPGTHVFRVDVPDRPSFSSTATIVEGERGRLLRLTLPSAMPKPRPAPVGIVPPAPLAAPPPPPSRSLAPPLVVAGASLVTLGTSAFLGITGRSELSQLHTSCAPTCTDEQVDPVRTKLILSDVALGTGIVGLAVAVYLFARSPGAATARLDGGPIPNGGSLGVRGAF